MAKKIEGVGPDALTVVNEAGGKQSAIRYNFTEVPEAQFAVAAVFHEGREKYGSRNWLKIEVQDHLDHLLQHVYASLAGDVSDDHLAHAACRALMALETELSTKSDLSDAGPWICCRGSRLLRWLCGIFQFLRKVMPCRR